MTSSTPEYAGAPRHPDHTEFLLELGRATYAASRLAGIADDVLRIHGGYATEDLYYDALGALEKKLQVARPPLDGIDEFLELLGPAREARNDLIHALPVANGLYRRTHGRIRELFTVESLREIRTTIETASRKGGRVLYADGGEGVRRWTEGVD